MVAVATAKVRLHDACAASSCAECVQAGCGWCAVERQCRAGTASGPSGSTCLWEFGRCSEPEPCSSRLSCTSCTEDAGCGWCATSNTCLEGAGVGPEGSATCNLNLGSESWVHARGLAPMCGAPEIFADPKAETIEGVIAAAAAREAQAKADLAFRKAQALIPCTTPAPTTTTTTTTAAPTTPVPTTPPPKTTQYYFVTQPPIFTTAPAPPPPAPMVKEMNATVVRSNASLPAYTDDGANATALIKQRLGAAAQAVKSPSAMGQIFDMVGFLR